MKILLAGNCLDPCGIASQQKRLTVQLRLTKNHSEIMIMLFARHHRARGASHFNARCLLFPHVFWLYQSWHESDTREYPWLPQLLHAIAIWINSVKWWSGWNGCFLSYWGPGAFGLAWWSLGRMAMAALDVQNLMEVNGDCFLLRLRIE